MRNYFEVHKNKKPRALRRRKNKYVSMLPFKLHTIGFMNAAQVHHISSTPIPLYKSGAISESGSEHPLNEISRFNKKLLIANQAIKCAGAILKACKDEQQIKFKVTGRYIH